MQASIIISTYNYPEALDLLLSSLVPQIKHYPTTEIIIADDGSSSDTLNMINQYRVFLPDIKHIWHDDNGFRKCTILNKAVAASTGEYLIFLDGDCIPFSDYLQMQLAFAERHYFVAGHRILLSKYFTSEIIKDKTYLERLLHASWFDWLRLYAQKKINKILPKIHHQWQMRLLNIIKFSYRNTTRWNSPKGCNFAVFRDDFFTVNGFDENYQGWGHEDSDLFIRLIHYGIKIKDAKFLIPVMHLWHTLASKDQAANNYTELLKRANNTLFIRSSNGINQYAER